jgi:hypothetical protein
MLLFPLVASHFQGCRQRPPGSKDTSSNRLAQVSLGCTRNRLYDENRTITSFSEEIVAASGTAHRNINLQSHKKGSRADKNKATTKLPTKEEDRCQINSSYLHAIWFPLVRTLEFSERKRVAVAAMLVTVRSLVILLLLSLLSPCSHVYASLCVQKSSRLCHKF